LTKFFTGLSAGPVQSHSGFKICHWTLCWTSTISFRLPDLSLDSLLDQYNLIQASKFVTGLSAGPVQSHSGFQICHWTLWWTSTILFRLPNLSLDSLLDQYNIIQASKTSSSEILLSKPQIPHPKWLIFMDIGSCDYIWCKISTSLEPNLSEFAKFVEPHYIWRTVEITKFLIQLFSFLNPLAPELFFFNFSTSCI